MEVEVKVLEAEEPWIEVRLQDGAVLRYKSVVSSVHRLDGHTDVEGNPVYIIKTAQAIYLHKAPGTTVR